MRKRKRDDTQNCFFVWIDGASHILSFQMVDGFERISFDSHDSMLAYAFALAASGYRVQ